MNKSLLVEKRGPVTELEQAIKSIGGEIGDAHGVPCMPLKHHFANGVYCRELFMPKGSVCTGQIHRYETNNMLMQGRVAVVNPEEPDAIYEAPKVWQSPAWTKRAIVALEDSIWVTTHPVDKSYTEDDLETIFKEVIADDFPALEVIL